MENETYTSLRNKLKLLISGELTDEVKTEIKTVINKLTILEQEVYQAYRGCRFNGNYPMPEPRPLEQPEKTWK